MMMLAMEYGIRKVFGQCALGDNLFDNLDPEPVGCALRNILYQSVKHFAAVVIRSKTYRIHQTQMSRETPR